MFKVVTSEHGDKPVHVSQEGGVSGLGFFQTVPELANFFAEWFNEFGVHDLQQPVTLADLRVAFLLLVSTVLAPLTAALPIPATHSTSNSSDRANTNGPKVRFLAVHQVVGQLVPSAMMNVLAAATVVNAEGVSNVTAPDGSTYNRPHPPIAVAVGTMTIFLVIGR